MLIYIPGHESWRSSELNQSCAGTCIKQGHVTLKAAVFNCLLWECFSASLSYCPDFDNANEPFTLLSEVKCSNFVWWLPLPGHEPLVRAPVFIGPLVWTVVVKPRGHTDGYCREMWGFHRDIGKDSIFTWVCRCRHYYPAKFRELFVQRQIVTMQKMRIFVVVVWLSKLQWRLSSRRSGYYTRH